MTSGLLRTNDKSANLPIYTSFFEQEQPNPSHIIKYNLN